LQEAKKGKTNASDGKTEKAKQSTASTKTKGSKQTGKGSDEKDSEEESADDDEARSKIVEEKEVRATKSGKVLQKTPKSTAVDSKDDLKSVKVKPEISKQAKVGLLKQYFQKM